MNPAWLALCTLLSCSATAPAGRAPEPPRAQPKPEAPSDVPAEPDTAATSDQPPEPASASVDQPAPPEPPDEPVLGPWPDEPLAGPRARVGRCGFKGEEFLRFYDEFTGSMKKRGARTLRQCHDFRWWGDWRAEILERHVHGGTWEAIAPGALPGLRVPTKVSFDKLSCMGFRREQTCGIWARYRRTEGWCRAAFDVVRVEPETVEVQAIHLDPNPPPFHCENAVDRGSE